MSLSPAEKPFQIRSLAISVYLPSFLFAVGQGAVIIAIPLFALDLGASVALAGAIVAVRGIGMLVFDVPAGMLVGRFGERGAMVIGTIALSAVAVGATFSPTALVFAPLVFVMGCAWSIWMLARLSYASEAAPPELRGRVLSLLGGSNRMGNFVGPLIGGFAGEWFGLESAFYIQAILAVAAAAVMFMVVSSSEGREDRHGATAHPKLVTVLRDNTGVFATAGVVSIAISVLRSTRQSVIPLWGDHIGMGESQIGMIFGFSSAIDMAMFYPAGVVMDRFGRKWAAIPCLVVLSAGMMAIPATGTFAALLTASLVTGFGNGLGAGINMTMGADYAPAASRAEFLGVWRFITDIGTAGGPVALSLITAASTLGAATVMTGGVGFAGAAVMYFLVTEPLKQKPPPAPEPQPQRP